MHNSGAIAPRYGSRPSSPAKAGDPVFRDLHDRAEKLRRTGCLKIESVAPYSKGGSAAAQPPFRASMIRFANRVFPFKIEPPTRTSGGNECAALCSPANADLN
jgi:hypothetical protein